MPYTFTITEVNPVITATVSVNNVGITVENIGFTITETTQSLALTNVVNTTTVYENAVELKVDDFDNYFMGDWSSSGVYRRGDLVNYNYSLYVSDISTGTTWTYSTNPALDTVHWRRVVWHEAPFSSLTVTGSLQVLGTSTLSTTVITGDLTLGSAGVSGGLTVNSSSTFNGQAVFNNTATFNSDIKFSDNTFVIPKLRVTNTSTFEGTATFQKEAEFYRIEVGTLGDNQTSIFNHTAEFLTEAQFPAGLYANATANLNIVQANGGVLTPSIQASSGRISIGGAAGASMQDLYIINDLTVAQDSYLNGKTTSPEFIGNTATIDYIAPRSGTVISMGNSTINKVDITTNLNVGTNLTVGTTSTFVGNSRFRSNVNVDQSISATGNISSNGDISATNNISVGNRLTTDKLNLGGLEYPSNAGLYGQVLTTNGSTTATWVNLGDLTAWSLNEDLYTNGYDIKTGYPVAPLVTPVPDLYIYRGDSSHDFGHIKFDRRHSLPANNPYTGTIYQDYQDIEIAAPSRLILTVGDANIWGSTASIILNTTTASSGIELLGDLSGANGSNPVRISSNGIRFSDGTVQTTAVPAVTVPVASAVTTGSVRIDTTYLTIAADGLLSVNTNTVLSTLVTATNARLGGVKIGSGLNIDGTGLLSLNTNSVVTITTQITSSTIESYFFSTSTTYVITNEVGKVNLVQDAYTNGYSIKYSEADVDDYLRVNQNEVWLRSNHGWLSVFGGVQAYFQSTGTTLVSGNYLDLDSTTRTRLMSTSTVQINSGARTSINAGSDIVFTVTQGTQTSSITVNPDNIELLAKTVINFLAPLVSIGTQTSVTQIGQLRVDKIYNYEGTFAPFFPAGVQFNDNTVQRTAFEPDQGLIGG